MNNDLNALPRLICVCCIGKLQRTLGCSAILVLKVPPGACFWRAMARGKGKQEKDNKEQKAKTDDKQTTKEDKNEQKNEDKDEKATASSGKDSKKQKAKTEDKDPRQEMDKNEDKKATASSGKGSNKQKAKTEEKDPRQEMDKNDEGRDKTVEASSGSVPRQARVQQHVISVLVVLMAGQHSTCFVLRD